MDLLKVLEASVRNDSSGDLLARLSLLTRRLSASTDEGQNYIEYKQGEDNAQLGASGRLVPAFGSGVYDHARAQQKTPAAADPGDAAKLAAVAHGSGDFQHEEELGSLFDGSGSHDASDEIIGHHGDAEADGAGKRNSSRKRKAKESSLSALSSGISGPCDHCGRKNSPAWRRGPSDKPHLCNACGVRFLGKGTLHGYMPGMKQRAEEERLARLMPNGVLRAEEEGVVSQEMGFQHQLQMQYSDSPATSRPLLSQPRHQIREEAQSWVDLVNQARASAAAGSWRGVVRQLTAAIQAARQNREASERHVAAELERAQRLFWSNKEASMRLLEELADVEMLLLLGAGGDDSTAAKEDAPTDVAPTPSSQWHEILRGIADPEVSNSRERLAEVASTSASVASMDSQVHPLVSFRLRALAEAIAAAPPNISCTAGLKALTEVLPRWLYCEACGKARLTHRHLRPWEDFTCGGEQALLPKNRGCEAAEDSVLEWYPPSGLVDQALEAPRQLARGKSQAEIGGVRGQQLDVLALVAEEAAGLGDSDHTQGRRTKRARLSQDQPGAGNPGDADLEKLPPGWRLETCMLRTGQGVSVADTSFVCPTSGSRFSTLQQALEHVKSRKGRVLTTLKADLAPLSHAPEMSLKRAVPKSAQSPPSVPLPAASLGLKQHTAAKDKKQEVVIHQAAANALGNLSSVQEWKAAQNHLADIVNSANAAAQAAPVRGAVVQPLHKHSSAPGGPNHPPHKSDPRPHPAPLHRSVSENGAMAPLSGGTPQDVTPEGTPERLVEAPVSHAPAESPTPTNGKKAPAVPVMPAGADVPATSGGYVIRVADQHRGPGRKYEAQTLPRPQAANAPTIRIITAASAAPPAAASYVPPFSFPGFSRGFSTVTTAVGLGEASGSPEAVILPPSVTPSPTASPAPVRPELSRAASPPPRASSSPPPQGIQARLPRRRVAKKLSPLPEDEEVHSPSLSPGVELASPSPRQPTNVPPLFRPVGSSSDTSTSAVVAASLAKVADRPQALGRAISDPQVLRRELEQGLHSLEDLVEVRQSTAGGNVLSGWPMMSPPGGGSFMPMRPLGRAISDPSNVRDELSDALSNSPGYLPSGTSLVSWQGVVRTAATPETASVELFTLVAALHIRMASALPPDIVISGFKARSDILMATVADKPLLLRLGQVTEKQMTAVIRLEELKLAAVAQLRDFDFALIPHTNSRNSLHIVGLKMDRSPKPDSPRPAMPTSPHARHSASHSATTPPAVVAKRHTAPAAHGGDPVTPPRRRNPPKAFSAQAPLDSNYSTRPRRESKQYPALVRMEMG